MYQVMRGDSFYMETDQDQKNLFLDYISLKKEGYKRRPLDQYDFFSTFYVVYKWLEGGYRPVMVQRLVSLSRCKSFGLGFPVADLVHQSSDAAARDAFELFLSEASVKDCLYPSGFTSNPDIDLSDKDKAFFVELTASFLFRESLNYKTESFVTSAVERFKTYRILQKAGFRFLGDGESIPKRSFHAEPVQLMGTHSLSSFCRESYESNLFSIRATKKSAA
jgi:hypothetical protein